MPIPTRRGDRDGKSRRDRTLIRKTSLLRDRSDVRAVKQRTTCIVGANADDAGDCAHARDFSRPDARSDLLFTMSENPHAASATREKSCFWTRNPTGGARRDRTDDLLLAKQALSQLSYGP